MGTLVLKTNGLSISLKVNSLQDAQEKLSSIENISFSHSKSNIEEKTVKTTESSCCTNCGCSSFKYSLRDNRSAPILKICDKCGKVSSVKSSLNQ